MNQAERSTEVFSVELEAALLPCILPSLLCSIYGKWPGLRGDNWCFCLQPSAIPSPPVNLQPRDAVHYACGWSPTVASHFPEGTETEPISCRLRGLWAAGKSIFQRQREWWTQLHCSKTLTATGHLPACDVETDDGPWVPHVGYVQTGKRRYP